MSAVLCDTATMTWGEMEKGAGEEDESVLLARIKSGDERAFEAMVRRFGGRMLAVAQRLLRDSAEAEDALQEAFLSAFKAIHRFEGQSQLGTWLHRIAINAALMKLRARKRRKDCSIEQLLPAFDADGHRRDAHVAWQAPGQCALERQEVRSMVRQKIDLLPRDYRTVLVLRDIEELSTEETASILGIRVGAVKTRLHRARLALRGLLQPELS